MRNLLRKELKLAASPVTCLFLFLGLLFLAPGYPILCAAFFVSLGLYQSFSYARVTNDTVFSALLPISKRDVVKAKVLFSVFIELCGFAVMGLCVLLRATVLADSAAYRVNALMNANGFALAGALVVFGLFNLIFISGFFKTAYKLLWPFVFFSLSAFAVITLAEAVHHVPGLEAVNSFGFENLGLQIGCLAGGAILYALMTLWGCLRSARLFEKVDL